MTLYSIFNEALVLRQLRPCIIGLPFALGWRGLRDQEPEGPATSAVTAPFRTQSPNRVDKAVDPIAAEHANERPPTRQVMQMGECLAQRKRHLMPVERASE